MFNLKSALLTSVLSITAVSLMAGNANADTSLRLGGSVGTDSGDTEFTLGATKKIADLGNDFSVNARGEFRAGSDYALLGGATVDYAISDNWSVGVGGGGQIDLSGSNDSPYIQGILERSIGEDAGVFLDAKYLTDTNADDVRIGLGGIYKF